MSQKSCILTERDCVC